MVTICMISSVTLHAEIEKNEVNQQKMRHALLLNISSIVCLTSIKTLEAEVKRTYNAVFRGSAIVDSVSVIFQFETYNFLKNKLYR